MAGRRRARSDCAPEHGPVAPALRVPTPPPAEAALLPAPQGAAAIAAAERRNPASRLHALPLDMFTYYLTQRYLDDCHYHLPGTTRKDTMRLAFEIPRVDANGLCVLPCGELCVVDNQAHAIRRFARDGSELRGARIDNVPDPQRMCLTHSGCLAVTCRDACGVHVYTAHGELVRAFGQIGTDEGQFVLPRDIALDRDGHLVVCDTGNQRLQVFTEMGEFVRSIVMPLADDGYRVTPGVLAVHPGTGHYYVAECVSRARILLALLPIPRRPRLHHSRATMQLHNQYGSLRACPGRRAGPQMALRVRRRRHVHGRRVHRLCAHRRREVSSATHRALGCRRRKAIENSGPTMRIYPAGDEQNDLLISTFGDDWQGEGRWPNAMACDSAGRLYIADGEEQCIAVLE